MGQIKQKRSAREYKEQLNLDAEPDAETMAMLEELRDCEARNCEARDEQLLENKPPAGLAEPWTVEQIKDVLGEAAIARTLGELLGLARQDSGLTLAEVGERIGVSRGRISQLEQPEANLEIKTLVKLANALGYDVTVTLKPRSKGRELQAELSHPGPT